MLFRSIRDGVAVIPIKGVITPQMDIFTALFGGTALDHLAQDIQAALDNNEVKAILLDIDSPGGVAVGPAEMAEIINHAKGIKPLWSYTGRNCCSAAYWLAAATDKILCHKSALLGSIGVVSTSRNSKTIMQIRLLIVIVLKQQNCLKSRFPELISELCLPNPY